MLDSDLIASAVIFVVTSFSFFLRVWVLVVASSQQCPLYPLTFVLAVLISNLHAQCRLPHIVLVSLVLYKL